MTTSEPRQTARYERKREAILEAAVKLFNARGLMGTTLADVAHSVGLTTTSVTYYFRRKEDLAGACVARAIEHVGQFLDLAAKAPSPPERLRRFVDLYVEYLAESAVGTKPPIISLWELRALTGPGAELATQSVAALFRQIRLWFSDPAGPVLSRTEQNARAFLVFASLFYAKEWIARYDVEDYTRVAEALSDVLVKGIKGDGAVWAPSAYPPAPPPSSVLEVSRDAFLRATTELVNEHGYRGASVDKISAKLLVTKGSFYHHNETKDDLVMQCFERSFEVIRAAHRAASRDVGDGWERICMIVIALVRYQRSEHGPLLRHTALAAMPEPIRPRLINDMGRLANRTGSVLVDGIVDGSIRPLDTGIAAQFIAGMINGAAELHHWVRGITKDEAVSIFVRPSLIGLFCGPDPAQDAGHGVNGSES
jgi:AcrR family transcriptional regulator